MSPAERQGVPVDPAADHAPSPHTLDLRPFGPIVEVRPVEPLGVEVMTLSATDVVVQMGRPFRRAFGHSRTGRRLGAAAWAAFHAALLHECGIAAATSHAQAAARERNRRTLVGPRWTHGRITRVVLAAAEAAANSS